MKKMKGAFSLNDLLVGTVRPPDLVRPEIKRGRAWSTAVRRGFTNPS